MSYRIGLVCPYSLDVPGGVQNHVLGFAGHLLAQGHDVQVLAPGTIDPTRVADAGFVADRVTSSGSAVPVRYNGSVARISFGPRSALAVRRWLAAHPFDIVHVHEPVTPSIALLALRAARTPVVATFHTATPGSRTMLLAGRVLRRTIDKIAAGIAVSPSARDVVVDHLGRHPEIVPNGFDHAAFRSDPPVHEPEVDRRRPRITFLGRLDEHRKGLDVLLAALPQIRSAVGDADVLVAGRGGRGGRHRRRAEGYTALGPLSDAARIELLRSSDVFVAPHRARESFGIVVIEAMTAGAAVVASDIPAFTDLLGGHAADGHLGFAFRAEDPADLAAGVVRALAADRHAVAVRAAAATRRYDWSVVGESIVEVYRRVLGAVPSDEPEPGHGTFGSRAGRKAPVRLSR